MENRPSRNPSRAKSLKEEIAPPMNRPHPSHHYMNRRHQKKCMSASACGGAFYGLGFIGAVVYYISVASGFWMGVLGFLKALVWPAMLVYELLVYIGA